MTKILGKQFRNKKMTIFFDGDNFFQNKFRIAFYNTEHKAFNFETKNHSRLEITKNLSCLEIAKKTFNLIYSRMGRNYAAVCAFYNAF